jgi:hypothetical protein
MRAKFLKDWLDKILDSGFFIDRGSDGQDSNIIKNLGTMFVALIGITIMVIVAFVLGFVIRYVPWVWNIVLPQNGCAGFNPITKSGILQGQGKDYQQLRMHLYYCFLGRLSFIHLLFLEKESEQTLGPRI